MRECRALNRAIPDPPLAWVTAGERPRHCRCAAKGHMSSLEVSPLFTWLFVCRFLSTPTPGFPHAHDAGPSGPHLLLSTPCRTHGACDSGPTRAAPPAAEAPTPAAAPPGATPPAFPPPLPGVDDQAGEAGCPGRVVAGGTVGGGGGGGREGGGWGGGRGAGGGALRAALTFQGEDDTGGGEAACCCGVNRLTTGSDGRGCRCCVCGCCVCGCCVLRCGASAVGL